MKRLGPRLLAIVCCLAALACAQDINASLSGTVTDSSGAVISGAAVVITNSDTGVVAYRGKTNESGVYSAPSLPVGRYRLSIESTGFSKSVTEDLKLQVDQRARVNVTLKPGELAETVTVH